MMNLFTVHLNIKKKLNVKKYLFPMKSYDRFFNTTWTPNSNSMYVSPSLQIFLVFHFSWSLCKQSMSEWWCLWTNTDRRIWMPLSPWIWRRVVWRRCDITMNFLVWTVYCIWCKACSASLETTTTNTNMLEHKNRIYAPFFVITQIPKMSNGVTFALQAGTESWVTYLSIISIHSLTI